MIDRWIDPPVSQSVDRFNVPHAPAPQAKSEEKGRDDLAAATATSEAAATMLPIDLCDWRSWGWVVRFRIECTGPW